MLSIAHAHNCIFGDNPAQNVLYSVPTTNAKGVSKENLEQIGDILTRKSAPKLFRIHYFIHFFLLNSLIQILLKISKFVNLMLFQNHTDSLLNS